MCDGRRAEAGGCGARTATRERVVAAAAPLFVARGYLDTTMAELAAAADVAVQTLYLAFGSKAAVLQAVWEAAGPDRPTAWAEALAAAEDGPAGAGATRRTDDRRGRAPSPAGRRVAGAAADPEPAELLAAARAAALDVHARAVDELAEHPGFTVDMSLQRATDVVATMLAPETYGLLVVQQGWTTPDWAEWALRHLVADLFPRAGPGVAAVTFRRPSRMNVHCCNAVAAHPGAGRLEACSSPGRSCPHRARCGALTVGATAAGLALVAFGDHPEAAAQAAHRLGVPRRRGRARRRWNSCGSTWRATAGVRPAARLVAHPRTGRRVLETLFTTVGYGETVTYGELAARSELGTAYTAARGVGAIMGSNPIPVVVPCHRVTAADGLGGFGGGRATKEWLLALEGCAHPGVRLRITSARRGKSAGDR